MLLLQSITVPCIWNEGRNRIGPVEAEINPPLYQGAENNTSVKLLHDLGYVRPLDFTAGDDRCTQEPHLVKLKIQLSLSKRIN